jgi:glucose-1-phosphate thymidylyltransferase
MKAVILTAGEGRRMRGLCSRRPKPMLPIANRPILNTTLSRLPAMGVKSVALVVGYQGGVLRKKIGDGRAWGVDVTYVWQKDKLGTGHAASLCEGFVGDEPFVLLWGDVLAHESNYAALAERFGRGDCDAVLAVWRVGDASGTAAVDVQDGWVTGIEEKPPPGTRRDADANAGLFIWPPTVFETLRGLHRSPRGEYEFTDAIVRFVERGGRVAALPLRRYRENVTDPEACLRANLELLRELVPASTAAFDPSVTLGADLWTARTEIGRQARIGDGCTLGPYVSVGERAEIGAASGIGPNVSVGPGSVVGPGGSIANAILMAGCRIGPGADLEYVVADDGVEISPGETLHGSEDRAIELLSP